MTWLDGVHERLKDAQSLPEAIVILRTAAGSHDKLASEIASRTGRKTTRHTVIRWEGGTFPGAEYSEVLRELGVPSALLTRVSRDEVERRLRQVEAEVAAIRREL